MKTFEAHRETGRGTGETKATTRRHGVGRAGGIALALSTLIGTLGACQPGMRSEPTHRFSARAAHVTEASVETRVAPTTTVTAPPPRSELATSAGGDDLRAVERTADVASNIASDAADGPGADQEPPRADAEPGDRTPRFFDQADGPILEALANEEIVAIERGRGGRSIGFKITLASGTRAYFKPEQNAGSTRWNAEVAAYRLDRALGLGRTAPSVGRVIAFERLRPAAGQDPRVSEIVVRDGQVRGALIYWIPGHLRPAPLAAGWERWVRLSELTSVDPFVAPPVWRRAVARREPPARAVSTAAPDTEDRAAELSDLVLFDYLTGNQDRWGGNYTNVRTLEENGPVVYLDNGAAFMAGRAQRNRLIDTRVETVQRFRRSTVEALANLDLDALSLDMRDGALGPYLSRRQLEGLAARRQHALDHIERLSADHGDAVTPW